MRQFFGSHARTSHVRIKVRAHTCAYTQFGVVALCTPTRTIGKITFPSFFPSFFIIYSNFFQQFFIILMFFFVFKNRIRCSKSGKNVPKQKKMFQNGIGRSSSRIVFKTSCIFWPQKVCKSVQMCGRTLHVKKGPHACTSHTLSRMDFPLTCTCATTHCTCACAQAPSQLIPC